LFPAGRRTRQWVAGCVLIALALIVWRAANVFLLFFLGVLFALFLRGVSDWSSRHLRVSEKWSLTVTLLVLVAVVGGMGFLLAPEVSEQFSKLRQDLPRAVQALEDRMNQYSWGRELTRTARHLTSTAQGKSVAPQAAAFLSSTFGVIGGLVVLVFVGVYLAAAPDRYVNGVVRLFPPRKRERAREVFGTVGTTLRRWLIGQLALMTLNGIVTTIVLSLLGIPLALSLGILSGLLNFIPNFGPIAAAIPAVLIASLEGPDKALYVVLFYVAYQNLDGYVFTPFVEKRAVLLPPALTIMAQVLLGVLLGAMGVLLAVPLTAMGLVLLKMLYVEDVFGERLAEPGDKG
jgi:predicted PurR-regulated permease PerM